MKYQDILPSVLEGKWVREKQNRPWVRMKKRGEWISEVGHSRSEVPTTIGRETFLLDTWEVKPYQGDIIVWGISIRNIERYDSYILAKDGFLIGDALNGTVKPIIKDGVYPLFPEAKTRKYKLIPVEEDDIVDAEFDPDESEPEKSFSVFSKDLIQSCLMSEMEERLAKKGVCPICAEDLTGTSSHDNVVVRHCPACNKMFLTEV